MNYSEYRNIVQNLEWTKWQAYQNSVSSLKELEIKKVLSLSDFWMEVGAYRIALPRAAGKTTLISKMAIDLHNKNIKEIVQVVSPYVMQVQILKESLGKYTPFIQTHTSNKSDMATHAMGWNKDHLLIDNAESVKPEDLRLLLSVDWKSVTISLTGLSLK